MGLKRGIEVMDEVIAILAITGPLKERLAYRFGEASFARKVDMSKEHWLRLQTFSN